MQYQSDYILRLIEQMGGLIRRAMERYNTGSDDEPYELAAEALGLALELDPYTIERLSPQSFAALLEMKSVDDRVLELVVQALEVQADALEREGEIVDSHVRLQQAAAVSGLMNPDRAN